MVKQSSNVSKNYVDIRSGINQEFTIWNAYITLLITYRKDFEHFALTCFKAFGDRVKHWITFNEPHGIAIQGYNWGIQAPGRCSILGHIFCKKGKSSTEPYVVAHNILLSHATVYHSYHRNFKVLVLVLAKHVFI